MERHEMMRQPRPTRSRASVLTVALLVWLAGFAVPVAATPPLATSGPDARYLYECGFMLLRCSGINMIRGLGLTRAQILKLREIAAFIDAVSPPPDIRERRDPKWGPIIGTFLRLERVLRSGAPIPETLRNDVYAARRAESDLIRSGLRYERKTVPFSCGRCHGEAGESRWNKLPWISFVANHPGIVRERSLSHAMAPNGLVGYLAVAWHAKRVDEILQESQKYLVSSFSCCLMPPKDIFDPVRIGQAEESDWEAPLLDRIRNASAITRPFVRFAARRFLLKRQRLLHPGLSGTDESVALARMNAAIDEALAIGDVDYALRKHDLAIKLRGDAEHPLLTAAAKRFKTAMFLLIPGSTAIYDDLLRETAE
ncbi:hypothetical protein KBA41_10815 [Candidatus Ozemobacteraceae bacterium]|nr:hypothetical protein [Candidatus Ozemobacteraceae bacterium]